MRANGWRGVVRTKKVRTTITDPAAHRPSDLVDRAFSVAAPNRLFVADFTYVRVSCGFVYTAFVIDAFAHDRRVGRLRDRQRRHGRTGTGRRAGNSATPTPPGRLVPSIIPTAGTQYTSIAFSEHLHQAQISPSIGSVGDAYDNALAETTIGLYKTECINPGHRSTPGWPPSATSSRPPLNGSTGTTPPGSCTASGADHR